MVWACDRLARSVLHFLEVLDELNRLNIEFVSFRENLDTGGALGRAVVVTISAIAELERSLKCTDSPTTVQMTYTKTELEVSASPS